MTKQRDPIEGIIKVKDLNAALAGVGDWSDGRFVAKNLTITYDPIPDRAYDKLPADIIAEAENIGETIVSEAEDHIPRLLKLIRKYPEVNQFRSWLITAYMATDNLEKAKETAERLVFNRPNYFFGKMNLAMIYLEEMELEKLDEILGGKWKSPYALTPKREMFHATEIVCYFYHLGMLSIHQEDWKTGKLCLKVVKQTLGKCVEYQNLKRLLSFRGKLAIMMMNRERTEEAA